MAPADAEFLDEIMRISQSQRRLQNQRAKHQIHCSKSLPDDFYLLCEEERQKRRLVPDAAVLLSYTEGTRR